MKYLLALLLTAFVLTGCAQTPPDTATPTEPTAATAPVGLWDEGAALEQQTQGAVRVYPLDVEDATGLFAMGESLLVLSGGEKTTLTRLTGSTLWVASRRTLDISLPAEDVQVTPNSICYPDPQRQQLIQLDGSLKEIRHIDLPQGCQGNPILSSDQDTLYYATETAIKAWDLTRNIHRTVKEMAQGQRLTGLFYGDTLLQCQVEEGVQLLSTEDGSLLWQGEDITLATAGDRFYAAIPWGNREDLIFGQGESIQALTPADLWSGGTFLPRLQGCLTQSQVTQEEIRLDYYNLLTGHRQSCLPLTDTTLLAADGTSEGWVYLLVQTPQGPAVYRWDPTSPQINDIETYTGPYYTRQEPDYHGLLRCQARARELSEQYGLELLLWDETEGRAPWDYAFQAEYQVPVLEEGLTQLENRLSRFPDGFLERCTGNFSGLTICLVRAITGTPESGSLASADGIEYLEGSRACIALALGPTSEKALYHELYHVMETQILNKSTALDQWDKLNPGDFDYTYDYAANESRNVGSWLDPDIRSFVDRYSMSYPKEDRARIFEYAMTAGNEALFAASPLQYKLKQLCIGIREAFGLKKHPEPLPWEQYLWQSLAYSK